MIKLLNVSLLSNVKCYMFKFNLFNFSVTLRRKTFTFSHLLSNFHLKPDLLGKLFV